MGRTVPTYRAVLESIIAKWNNFRKALREEDRKIFDEVMNKARAHASASSYQASLDPLETVFLSILLEQEKKIKELEELIRRLKK